LQILRKKFPDAFITLISGTRNYMIARWCPDVDQIILCPLFSTKNINDIMVEDAAQLLKKLLKSCGTAFPDLGIVLRWDVDFYGAAALLYRLEIPNRIGYSEHCTEGKSVANKGYDNFYTQIISDDTIEHEVIKNIKLIDQNIHNYQSISLQIQRYETIDASNNAASYMRQLNLADKFIAIGIGSSLAFKTLDYSKWIDLIKNVISNTKRQVCIFGGKEDVKLADDLSNMLGCISLTGLLRPIESFSILKHAVLVISTDSFVKHLAAAADVPTIELSSHSKKGDPKSEFGGLRFGAWGNRSIIIKPPGPRSGCHVDKCLSHVPHCILDIDINEVSKAINLMLPPESE
jgi:ADP-heptose:LPS heptosyltransferase